jgi:hypothetical protein
MVGIAISNWPVSQFDCAIKPSDDVFSNFMFSYDPALTVVLVLPDSSSLLHHDENRKH